MATGYFGEVGKYELGWWNNKWRGPVVTQSNHTLTRHTATTWADWGDNKYYTSNVDTLTLPSDEYPLSIQFSDYTGTGWWCAHDDYDLSNPGVVDVYLCYANGETNHAKRKLATFSINRQTGSKTTRTFSVPDGKALAGKALEIYVEGTRAIWFDGQAKVTVVTSKHVITWENPSLSFRQNEYDLIVTKSGSAADNWGESFAYHLKVDGVDKGAFDGDEITVTLTDDDLEIPHTFELVAVGSAITSLGYSVSHTPQSVHKTVKYWDGSVWIECVASYYDEIEQVEVEPYYYDGANWIPCSHT